MVKINEINSGIYCIENKINNKKYIGQSIDIRKRWREHRTSLNNNKHHNKYLQRAWNKYGEENFDFYIIQNLPQDTIHIIYNIWEIYYIDEYKTQNPKYGYNMTIGGEGTVGHVVTDETRKKISETQKGRKLTKEWIEHISQAHKDKIKNGYKPKTEHFQKYNEEQKTSINCYDKDGNYICSYSSIQEAGRDLGLEATNICKVLKRKHSNIKGYVFYYSNESPPDKMEIFLRCSRCPLILYDLDGNEIKIFHDCGECSDYTKTGNSAIARACKRGNVFGNIYRAKYYYDLYPNNKPIYNR